MGTTKDLGDTYLPRVVDRPVSAALDAAGAVLIEGPRACGKTMTGMHHAQSSVLLDDEAMQELVDIAPDGVLDGPDPRLLDEWQVAPPLWNAVRRRVDRAGSPGQFILTGSAVPADDLTRHTGAGRFLRIRQRTMTVQEKGLSSETVSLEALLAGERVTTQAETPPLDEVVSTLLTPGFPAMVQLDPQAAGLNMRAYLQETARADIRRLANLRHEPVVVDQLLRALARSVASEVSLSTLRSDLATVAPDISRQSVGQLVELLERVFVVESVPAWTPALRSRARLRTSPKYHLADPALTAVALNADSTSLLNDPHTLGLLFESAVIHDLAIYAESLGGSVHHFRDSNGHEIDAVITLPGGRWAGVEVKLGGRQINDGADRLATAAVQIHERLGPPAFLAVISGTGYTAPLPNGVETFPLSSLRG